MTESFASVMQQTTGQNNEMQNTDLSELGAHKADVQSSASLRKDNTKVAQQVERDTKTATEPKKDETLTTAKNEVNKTAEKVVEKVADAMGVSEKEVEQAMETLGLTAVNLLDSTNLAKLMLNLSGETDMMALTTDEGLYMGMKDILGFIQQELTALQEMYGLSGEQLNDCIASLQEESMEQLFAKLDDGQQDETMPVFDVRAAEGNADEMAEQSEKAVVTIMKNGEEVKAVVETDAKSGASAITQESAPLTEQSDSMEQGQQNGSGEQAGKETSQGNNMVLQNLAQGQNTAAVNTNMEVPFAEAQVQEIMDQIMDFVKVHVKADTTSLEMQLHPESLGTLNIRIAAKDGVLTAQFTAQNEAVKNVIEGQLVTLQQNLNEQGVKVEAVEVNVATQQFDRNLNQGQENNGKPSEEAKKKNPRRINLNDLDALAEEELDEADKVTADMMARNGNTVDYLA